MKDMVDYSAVAAATGVASYQWVSTANDIATLAVTIAAALGGLMVALHRYEMWRQKRNERLDQEEKD